MNTQEIRTLLKDPEKEKMRAKELANMADQTFSEIDKSLFPSELSFPIQRKSKEVHSSDSFSDRNSRNLSIPEPVGNRLKRWFRPKDDNLLSSRNHYTYCSCRDRYPSPWV